MFDRAEAAWSRILRKTGPVADRYRMAAEAVRAMPDHPLRDRALLRLADSLDDALALEEKIRQSRPEGPEGGRSGPQ